jgi:polyphosphate kinase
MMRTDETKEEPEHDSSAILAFETGTYPYSEKMSRSNYEDEKAALQSELLKVQLWIQDTGQKRAKGGGAF